MQYQPVPFSPPFVLILWIKTACSSSKKQSRLATKARILDAALEVFTKHGFESANLDLVAMQAGCSRGAIYAHYASKEEVFLGLRDHHLRAQLVSICAKLEEIPDLEKRRAIFKRWVIGQIADPFWGILMLEYKLHTVRNPEDHESCYLITNHSPRSRSAVLSSYSSGRT